MSYRLLTPLFIAVAIALLVLVYYLVSGRNSFDLNVQHLQKSENVENAVPTSHNSVVITCKNGGKYEIVYKNGQTNFQDLVYDKCGSQGALE